MTTYNAEAVKGKKYSRELKIKYLKPSSISKFIAAAKNMSQDSRNFYTYYISVCCYWVLLFLERGEREKDRENLNQAPCPAQSPKWGSVSHC